MKLGTIIFLTYLPLFAVAVGGDEKIISLDTLYQTLPKDKESPIDTQKVADDFKKIVDQTNFSPSADIPKKTRLIKEVADRLIREIWKNQLPPQSGQTIVIASSIKSLLDKIDASIEENYQFQLGTANVSPPPGIPNASAGMDPDAIDDVRLKRIYLDSIANEGRKQLKNAQQIELNSLKNTLLFCISSLDGWRSESGLSKKQLIEQFTNKGKSREALQQIVFPGKKVLPTAKAR